MRTKKELSIEPEKSLVMKCAEFNSAYDCVFRNFKNEKKKIENY